MTDLAGTRTLESLRAAFSRESQTNRRYLWFAQQADIDGQPEAAAAFRAVAEAETGHTHDLLEFLAEVGDPISEDTPLDDTEAHLRASIAAEVHDATELYPGYAAIAREEGFNEIADWLEMLAKAEAAHAERFRTVLEDL